MTREHAGRIDRRIGPDSLHDEIGTVHPTDADVYGQALHSVIGNTNIVIVIVIAPTFSCVGRRCLSCCVSVLTLRFFVTSNSVF